MGGVTVKDTKVATMGCRRLTNNNRRLSTTGIKADFTYESTTNVAVDQKASDFGTELQSQLKAAGLPDAVIVQKIAASVQLWGHQRRFYPWQYCQRAFHGEEER